MILGVSAVLPLIAGAIDVAKQILLKSNTKENRKYIDAYVEAEQALLAEKNKPMEDQLDNVVEHFEQQLEILFNASKAEYERQKVGQ